MHTKLATFVVILLMSLALNSKAQNFNHPGLLSSKAELDFVKEQIATGKEPWTSALNHIKSLNFDQRNPSPLRNLVGIDNHDPMDEMTKDGSAAYACALLWYHTGEQKYANQAIKILNAWNIFETHDNWLFLSWAVPQFLNAAEIIRTSDAGWSLEDQNKFKTMVQNRWLQPVKNNIWVNNAMMTTIEAHIAVSIYLDNEVEFNAAVNKWRRWLPSYMYMKSDGSVPVTEGRSQLSYWGTAEGKYLDGQVMENCRDLNHTKMGTYGLMHGAEMAYQQGVDLWEQEGERFAAFVELHAGWMTGEVKVPSWMCKGDGINCTGRSSGGSPPCNQSNWDIAISQLVNRLGYDLPIGVKMTKANRNKESDTKRNFKFETLTHGDLPYNNIDRAPLGYTFAADENDTVKIEDTVVDIAYGAYGEFKYLYDQTSDAVCNSATFGGDPLADSTKRCYIKPVVFVDGVSLDKNSLIIEASKTAHLKESISPLDAKYKTVSWSSSDSTIAKVDENGLVTAIAVGETAIKVKTNDGCFTDSCVVTVVAEIFPNIEYSDGAQDPNIPENILDGLTDDNHRWSVSGYPKAVVVDYGEIKNFTGFKLYTYQERSYHYTIAISDSANSGFATVVDQSGTVSSQPIEHTFSSTSGRYVKLTVTGATGYSSNWISINELEMIAEVPTSLHAAELSKQIFIFPNPADQVLTISLPSQNDAADVKIVNLNGQEILSKKVLGNNSNINIKELPQGVYIINISYGEAQLTRKFIKK